MRLETAIGRIVRNALIQRSEWNGIYSEMLKYKVMRDLLNEDENKFVEAYYTICERIKERR